MSTQANIDALEDLRVFLADETEVEDEEYFQAMKNQTSYWKQKTTAMSLISMHQCRKRSGQRITAINMTISSSDFYSTSRSLI